MPKYYIKSGQIKHIIDRENHDSAILDTLKYYKGRGLLTGVKICISEKGFETFKEWTCYDSYKYIKNTEE